MSVCLVKTKNFTLFIFLAFIVHIMFIKPPTINDFVTYLEAK